MGKINTTKVDRFGVETRTEVRTNRFEDFLIEACSLYGKGVEWRMVHLIERRKLRRTR